MNISGVNGLNGIRPATPSAARPATQAAESAGAGVEVQLSGPASWISQVRSSAAAVPGIRMDEVQRARQEISNGTLEQNVNMNAVLDSLIMEL